MATNETTRSSGGVLATIGAALSIILMLVTIGAVALIAFPYLKAQPISELFTLPTSSVRAQPTSDGVVTSRNDTSVTFDQINATSQAIYQATAQAAEVRATPLPNVNNTGDTSPSIRISKPADRPAPPPPGEASAQDAPSDAFGSKPVGGPVDIQGTHQCLHGQVWTDTGCHKPTPVN